MAGALEQVAVGCRDDLAAIYRDYWDLVYKRCYATLQDHEAALDATQDVFLQALNTFEDIQHDVVRGLVDLARTISYERKRRPTREVSLADPRHSDGHNADPAEIAERHRVLDHVWSSLSPVERRYVADKFAGFSFEEIARRNRRALGTVSSNLARAREHARKIGEPLLPGAIGFALWRRLTDASRRARNAAHNSSVAAAAQPVGSMTVSLTLASLIAGAVPVATVASARLVPSAQAPMAATLDQVTLNASRAGATVGQPTFAGGGVPAAGAASPHGAAGPALPHLLPTASASSETPEDTQFFAATPSPNYAQDHTIVALGHGTQCSCQVLMMSRDGGATWQTEAAPATGDQIVLPPAFPTDPMIFVGASTGQASGGNFWTPGFGQPFQQLRGLPAGTLTLPAGFDQGDRRVIATTATTVWSTDFGSGTATPLIVDMSGLPSSTATPYGESRLGVLVLSSTNAVAPGSTSPALPGQPGEDLWACPPAQPCALVSNVMVPAGANLAASPTFSSDGTLIATTRVGQVFVSTDHGRSFTETASPAGGHGSSDVALGVLPQGVALWASIATATGSEVLTKPSLDAAWSEADHGDPTIRTAQGRLVVVNAQTVLFLIAQGGLRCTVNGGVTWEARCPGV